MDNFNATVLKYTKIMNKLRLILDIEQEVSMRVCQDIQIENINQWEQFN